MGSQFVAESEVEHQFMSPLRLCRYSADSAIHIESTVQTRHRLPAGITTESPPIVAPRRKLRAEPA
jgi:hypothetical protein